MLVWMHGQLDEFKSQWDSQAERKGVNAPNYRRPVSNDGTTQRYVL